MNEKNMKSRTLSRFQGTWSLGRPVSVVKVDMSSKTDIQDVTFALLSNASGLPKPRLRELLSHSWPPEKWNLLSVVLQALFEDHPSVPEILVHIESLGAFPWKLEPT